MQYSSYRLGSQFVARSRFGRLKLSVTESVWIHFWGMGTKAVAKSCGGHIESIHHVIQAVANLSSYSLGSQSASILYGDSSPQLLLDFEIKCDTVLGIWGRWSY